MFQVCTKGKIFRIVDAVARLAHGHGIVVSTQNGFDDGVVSSVCRRCIRIAIDFS
jgi:hypothetical protein